MAVEEGRTRLIAPHSHTQKNNQPQQFPPTQTQTHTHTYTQNKNTHINIYLYTHLPRPLHVRVHHAGVLCVHLLPLHVGERGRGLRKCACVNVCDYVGIRFVHDGTGVVSDRSASHPHEAAAHAPTPHAPTCPSRRMAAHTLALILLSTMAPTGCRRQRRRTRAASMGNPAGRVTSWFVGGLVGWGGGLDWRQVGSVGVGLWKRAGGAIVSWVGSIGGGRGSIERFEF